MWEWLPEFIAPTLTGVSIFCLAGMKTKADNVWWSRVFGGSYPNQGMALFSLTFDWCASPDSLSPPEVSLLGSVV